MKSGLFAKKVRRVTVCSRFACLYAYLVCVGTLVFVSPVQATAPIEPEYLTQERADELGFTLDCVMEANDTSIGCTLEGPLKIGESCIPVASGAFYADQSGTPLGATLSRLGYEQSEKPAVLAATYRKGDVAEIFIDYICSQGAAAGSKRYTVKTDSGLVQKALEKAAD
ncbi:MAG: hypothetical protein AAGJ09_06675 [Pseudomonadota bacterium]